MRVSIDHAEALDWLRSLKPGSVDAVVTDPPYSSGGLHRSDRAARPEAKYAQNGDAIGRPSFSGDNRDQRSWAAWAALWLMMALQATREGGRVYVFSDWRMLPALTDAIQMGGWVWRGIVPWNKTRGSRAPHTGYHRHQCEYIVWGTAGPCEKRNGEGPFPGLITEPVRQADKHHLTGKPTDVMRQLVRAASRPDELVIDPFAGSGTTAVACAMEGRRFMGCELSAEYCDVARVRIEDALSTPALDL
ncbi:MAG: DNA methyltransferase [Bacteroidota bacterium]